MPNKQNSNQREISWTAPEFVEHQRTTTWYIVAGLVALALMVFAVYSRSIITIITFALLIAVGFIFVNRKPNLITHAVSPSGIRVNKLVYPYKNIRKFWIVYRPPEVKTLNFETTAYLNRIMTLQLGGQDPLAVKLFLKKYLPEDLEAEEMITDAVARRLKF